MRLLSGRDTYMKIAFFSFPLHYKHMHGGMVHTFNVCRNLAGLGNEVGVFVRSSNFSHFQVVDKIKNVEVYETRFAFATFFLGFETLIALISTTESYQKVVKIMEKREFDIIIDRFCMLNPWSRHLSGKFNLPLILEVHSLPITEKYRSLLRKDMMCQFENSKAIITQTESQKSVISRFTNTPIYVIPNGVDVDLFKPTTKTDYRRKLGIGQDEPVVALLGSFAQFQGYQLLPKIAEYVLKEHENVKFILIGGKIPQRDYLIWYNDRTDFSSIEKRKALFLTGKLPYTEVPKILAISDVCISLKHNYESSLREDGWRGSGGGAGIRLYEYMAIGKPIVAFDYPEIRKVVRDCGLYAKPIDTKDFAKKILHLIENHDLRRKLGEKARKMAVREYDWRSRAREYLQVCNTVLQ